MSSRGSRRVWVFVTLAWLTACGDGSTTSARARERVLARIPADVRTVLAAEGHALSHAHVRAVIDVLRPHWPARMGCAIDAALTGQHVAVGIGPRGTTLAIETGAEVDCPALSNIADGLWVATIGDGSVATETSVLDDPKLARARQYLVTSPIAAAVKLDGGTAIASARPEPLEAWFAFDTTPEIAVAAEKWIGSYLSGLASRPVTGPFAQRIKVSRSGSQVVAALEGPVDADLSVAVRLALEELDAPEPLPDVAWACPRTVRPAVLSCAPGPEFRVTSIREVVAPIVAATLAPVIQNTRVRGLRLGVAIPELGLEATDVLIGVGGRAVVDRDQVVEIFRRARGRISIVVERGQRTNTLSLVEP